MTNTYQINGIMLYCFKKDAGILIIGNRIPFNINIKTPMNEWEDVGTFKIDCHGIVTLYPSDTDWLLHLKDNWHNSYFLNNIYNKNMELVMVPKKYGIVFKCFEDDEICFLLSDKVPLKGFDKLYITIRASTDWEDIGTFHIEKNKVIYNNSVVKPKGGVYDANLIKINIPSY